jgi:hypothetical protein
VCRGGTRHDRVEPRPTTRVQRSTRCHNVAVRHSSTEDDIRQYFWSLVDKNGPLPDPATGVRTKCWLWLGSVTDQGYGRFKAGGEMYMARRFAWLEMGKPDPDALTVSTRCENKLCLRHLNTRIRAEIMASVSRRWASGEASHLARVSSKQVLLIRKLTRGATLPRTRWPSASASRHQT